MPRRHLPVRPHLDQLRRQAKELLRSVQNEEPDALTEFRGEHPDPPPPRSARLADAQLALARSYGVASWPRLNRACRVVQAIWEDDAEALRRLLAAHPELLHEPARGVDGNWGPPMAYAANLGRTDIVRMLHDMGARDLQWAFDRALLQGQSATARSLHELCARPEADAIMGPAETLSGVGMALALDLGATVSDEHGNRLAPVAMVLETYTRRPDGKHRCLEILSEQGIDLPDTPTMALHRGRIDLLERHLERDAGLFARTFSHREIWPPELGCHADETLALHGTPLAGGTLLHIAVDYDEMEIARWLLTRGADPDTPAATDADGFGGHTALFGCVVSQPHVAGLRRDDAMARLLLEHGANPRARASLRKRLRFVEDESWHEYRDVDVVTWGERFHGLRWVNAAAMAAVRSAAAGRPEGAKGPGPVVRPSPDD